MMLQKLVDDNHINIEEEDLKMIKDIIDSDKATQNKNYERSIKQLFLSSSLDYLQLTIFCFWLLFP